MTRWKSGPAFRVRMPMEILGRGWLGSKGIVYSDDFREFELRLMEYFPSEIEHENRDNGRDEQADGVVDGIADEDGAVGVQQGDHGVSIGDPAQLGTGFEGDGIDHVGGEEPH